MFHAPTKELIKMLAAEILKMAPRKAKRAVKRCALYVLLRCPQGGWAATFVRPDFED